MEKTMESSDHDHDPNQDRDSVPVNVTPAGGALTSLVALTAALNGVDTSIVSGRSGLPLLQFKSRGNTWTFGQKHIVPEEGSAWAFNPMTFKRGYVSFNDSNRVVGEHLVSVSQPMPDKAKLLETGFPYQEEWAVNAKCITGTDAGTEVIYKATTVGGTQAIVGLLDGVRDRLNGNQHVAAWNHLAHLRIAVLNGNPEQRRSLLATAHEREVTVIGIDLTQWLVDELADIPGDHPLFDTLIIDETSRLKDPSGKRSRALARIAGRFRTRWGLTGTPRPNSSQDLFMPAAIITDGALWGRAFVPWQKQYFRLRNLVTDEWVPLPGAEETIAAEFGTVAMTVEDMPDLPPLNIVETPVRLPDTAMATYKTMARELFATVEGRSIEAASPLIATGKLAQLANGFLYGEGADDPVSVHDLKIEWLRELVESLDGEPLLIAYEFVEDLRTIRRAFRDVPTLSDATPKEASQLIEAWNAGELPLLALHPASAAHGLNLQFGGSRMAWLSPSWSAELTEQAIARIYRPGQTRHVTIHICIAVGTVDQMKRNRVLGKMSAQEAFRRHLEQI
jgi:hypothetical protein